MHTMALAVANLQSSFLSSAANPNLKWDPLRTASVNLLRLPSLSIAHKKNESPRPLPFPLQVTRPKCTRILSLKHESPPCTAEQHLELSVLENPSTLEASPLAFFKKTMDFIMKASKALQKPALVALVVGLLLTQTPDAWAASGGAMGGRAFSSGRSSGSYPSRSFSAPRSGFSFSTPYAAPSPFFGGGFGSSIYVGPAYGIGLGGGGSFFFLLLGCLAFFLVSGFLSDRSESGLLTASRKTSVLKLQVGLLGMARSLQKELDRLADRADTSSPQGLHLLLTETVLTLLRHPDYCISGYSSSDIKRNVEAGEKRFNELSLEERAKFDEETVVNVDSFFRRNNAKARGNSFNNEYIVVTVLVAAEGEHTLPTINSNADLKEALRKIGSIPTDQTLAVEVLWTPQVENDTLSERELLRDYPLLRSL